MQSLSSLQAALSNALSIGYVGLGVALIAHGIAWLLLRDLPDDAQERAKRAGSVAFLLAACIALAALFYLVYLGAQLGLAVIVGAIAACVVLQGVAVAVAAFLGIARIYLRRL